MKTLTIGKHRIGLYDSIDEMPMRVFNDFNQALLVDANVGFQVQDLDKRLGEAYQHLEAKDQDGALKSLRNLRITFHNATIGNNTKANAFAVLIKTYNGFKINLDEMSLDEIMEKLYDAGLTMGDVQETLSEVKKKSTLKQG